MQFISTLLLCKHARSTRSGLTIKWPTVPPAPSIHLNTTRSIYYDTKYTHQVANNASVYFLTFHYNPISFSYAHFRSSTLQYVQSQSSKNAHVYFSNISCHPLIIQSRPGSSRIFNQSILQDPQ